MQNLILIKDSGTKDFFGITANNIIYRIVMLITIIITTLGVMSPVEVKSSCPPQGPDDCDEFKYVESKTIEYPVNSGCFITFEYCSRISCEGELEIYLDIIGYTGSCNPPVLTQDLYMECLDVAMRTVFYSPHLFGIHEIIPPCPDNTFGVIAYTPTCKTDWYPYNIFCPDGIQGISYKTANCNNADNGYCLLYWEYCWEGAYPEYVLKRTFMGSTIVNGGICHPMHFLLVDGFLSNWGDCFGNAREIINDLLNELKAGCRGLTGQALNDCIIQGALDNPAYSLDALLKELNDCCPDAIGFNYFLKEHIKESFPDGIINCSSYCY